MIPCLKDYQSVYKQILIPEWADFKLFWGGGEDTERGKRVRTKTCRQGRQNVPYCPDDNMFYV